jgi:hypothetical protein
MVISPWKHALHWLERRLADPHRLRTGLLALLAIGVAYGLCILVLALGGAWPQPTPWLTLPLGTYFYWEAAFIGPVILAGTLLSAACMHLLARAAGGQGTFEDTLALLGPAVAVGTLTTVIPDFIIGGLLCAGVMTPAFWMESTARASWVLGAVWVYLTAYLVAFGLLFPAVVAVAHRVRTGAAVAIGLGTFVIYQGFLFIFVR